MQLIITETASVARILATFFNANNKHFGYYSSQTHFVVWIDDCKIDIKPLDFKKVSKENSFQYKLRPLRLVNKSAFCPVTLKKLALIKELVLLSKSIVFASEPSGILQTRFEYLKQYLNITIPNSTVLLTSLDKGFLKRTFLSGDTDKLTNDFIVQAYHNRNLISSIIKKQFTKVYQKVTDNINTQLCLYKTPLLSLICLRYLNSKASRLDKTYKVRVNINAGKTTVFGYLSKDYKTKQYAQRVAKAIEKEKEVTLQEIKVEAVEQEPILLYDFFSLSIKAYKLYGYQVSKTLEVLLSLYRQRFITYPFTLSQYLSYKYKDRVPKLLNALRDYPLFKEDLLHLKLARLNYKSVLKKQNLENHGILTTLKIPTDLNVCEKAIYELIAKRSIDSFTPKKEIRKAKLKFLIKNSLSHLPIEVYTGDVLDMDYPNVVGCFNVFEGEESFKVDSTLIVEKTNSEVQSFTFTSTLEYIRDEFLGFLQNKAVAQSHICFFSDVFLTLSLTLEKLIENGYLYTSENGFVCHEKALDYYKKTKNVGLNTFSCLFEFELLFYKQSKAEIKKQEFYNTAKEKLEQLERAINDLTNSVKSLKGVCPICLESKFELGYNKLICLNKKCNWTIPRLVSGVYLSETELEELLNLRRINKVFVFTTRNKVKFKANLYLDIKGGFIFNPV
ncbi:DNA topoisomerase-3 [Myroides marinus]|uniref:DNA topoisomerase-3 n=1 Tax=Myroides marinus TaxID=703342 RepID=A0A1H6Y6S4_9FLAO|nr:DNA topoisomerase [Myroides marinus]SEJ32892.1 DNA topoisomerase-3 [Myroides marinus]